MKYRTNEKEIDDLMEGMTREQQLEMADTLEEMAQKVRNAELVEETPKAPKSPKVPKAPKLPKVKLPKSRANWKPN